MLVTEGGELVESVSASNGLPVPLEAVGRINNQVAVKAGGRWWLADLERVGFDVAAPTGEVIIRQLIPDQFPDAIRENIPVQEQWLTWERLLLDLHSGRLLGTGGANRSPRARTAIILDYGFGLSSSFLHLSKVLVEVGQEIQRGDVVGEVGATGRATGPTWTGATSA